LVFAVQVVAVGSAAVEKAFGSQIDYAMLVKTYGTDPNEDRKFSPPVVLSEELRIIQGDPDPSNASTSYVERQNLTMRMGMRRFTRLTNGFSKKVENHAAMVALHYMYYNFGQAHKSLANPYPRTPAMAAGFSDHVWSCEEIARLIKGRPSLISFRSSSFAMIRAWLIPKWMLRLPNVLMLRS
jgi:hypothetical protein